MFADSALFLLAAGLRSLLAQHIEGLDIADVLIGTPKQANDIVGLAGQGPTHALNLFFYRFEPGGYPSMGAPTQPLYLRAFCLLTAFAGKSNDKGGVGQNDLRLLGDAIRVLHQNPRLGEAAQNEALAAVQVVPTNLTIHELNQVWSMMGSEVSYRPSAAYELSLVPIPLDDVIDSRSRVATVEVRASPHDRRKGQPRREPPRLALITPDGLAYALVLPLAERPDELDLQIDVDVDSLLILCWRLLEDKSVGWVDGPRSEPLISSEGRLVERVELPLTTLGQALVWAEIDGDPSRASKPVLVILHEGVDS